MARHPNTTNINLNQTTGKHRTLTARQIAANKQRLASIIAARRPPIVAPPGAFDLSEMDKPTADTFPAQRQEALLSMYKTAIAEETINGN